MLDLGGFKTYFVDVMGAKENVFPNYRWYLRGIDELAGGIDEKLAEIGFDGVRKWALEQTAKPFDKRPSDARSILKSYLGFKAQGSEGTIETASDQSEGQTESSFFKLEKEMQRAIRSDLESLEAGLVAIDDGVEVTVEFDSSFGRIDILARDMQGGLVVIELKAGPCPAGAIEQTLSYVNAIAIDRDEKARAILIAGSFRDRLLAAARQIPNLTLKTYSYKMAFFDA
jgi:Holliday junction resolvase-like predicted endonuclease